MLARKNKSSRRGPITASTLKSRDRNNLQRGKLIVVGLERGAALALLIWLLRLAGPALVWLAWLLCLGWPGSSGWVALAWFGWPGCSGLVGLAPTGCPWPGLAGLAALAWLAWLLRLGGPRLVWLAWLALAWLAWLLRLDGPGLAWPCGNRCVYLGGRGGKVLALPMIWDFRCRGVSPKTAQSKQCRLRRLFARSDKRRYPACNGRPPIVGGSTKTVHRTQRRLLVDGS